MKQELWSIGLGLALCCVSAIADDVLVTVDAQQNCLNTDTMSGTPVRFAVPPGTYAVYLENNTMVCESGAGSWCNIDSVFFQVGDVSSKKRSANWGMVAHGAAATKITVDSSGSAPALAFISDNICSDNLGQTTLHFHQMN